MTGQPLDPQQLYILLAFAVVTGVVLLIDFGLFIAWALRKPQADAGLAPPLFAPRWSLVHVWAGGQIVIGLLLTIMFGVMLLIALASLAGGKAGSFRASRPDDIMLPMILILLVVQNALLAVVPAWFITRVYRTPLREIGMGALPGRRELALGLGVGLAMWLVSYGLEASLMWALKAALPAALVEKLVSFSKSVSVESILPQAKQSPGLYALLFLGGAVGAPIGEEFFFRGWLYNAAKHRAGLVWGAVISAAVFALAHAGPIQVVIIFLMGLALAFMYERTRSLWVPILMHAANNGISFLVAYFFMRST